MQSTPPLVDQKSNNRDSQYYWLFLIVASLIGMGLAIYATVPFGAGVSGDGARNMSTAENLLRGKGFFDHFGTPLVFWPPLYPIILASLGSLFQGDVFLGGWYLNIFLMGLNIFLSGVLLLSAFPNETLFRYIGCIFVLLSVPALRIYANIASDPLFITFSLLFLIAANRYLDVDSKSAFWAMIVLSALASLQRFLGLSLTATGCLLILRQYWHRQHYWQNILRDNLIFGILSIIPLATWIIFHNIIGYGTFWGNLDTLVLPWENLRLSIIKILHWFFPFQFFPEWVIKNPLISLAVVLLCLLLVNKKKDWLTWRDAVFLPNRYPTLLFLPISILGLILTIATPDHRDLYSDRYYAGLLVPVLAWIFVAIEYLIRPHLGTRIQFVNIISLVIFAIWSVYPIYGIWEFLSTSHREGGVVSYNVHNTKTKRNSKMIAYVSNLVKNNDTVLYSNDPNTVWFIIRRDVQLLPWLSKEIPFDETVKTSLTGWPGTQDGYIIWLKPDYYETTLTPDELAQIANLELIYSSSDGDIYYVNTIDK